MLFKKPTEVKVSKKSRKKKNKKNKQNIVSNVTDFDAEIKKNLAKLSQYLIKHSLTYATALKDIPVQNILKEILSLHIKKIETSGVSTLGKKYENKEKKSEDILKEETDKLNRLLDEREKTKKDYLDILKGGQAQEKNDQSEQLLKKFKLLNQQVAVQEKKLTNLTKK